MVKKVAILANGGDVSGFNAVIRAIVKAAEKNGVECYGFIEGYRGLLNNDYIKLSTSQNSRACGILPKGGSIIGSSTNANVFHYKVEENGQIVYKDLSDKCVQNIKDDGFDCLFTLGGDGTQKSARDFSLKGINVIGVPKQLMQYLLLLIWQILMQSIQHIYPLLLIPLICDVFHLLYEVYLMHLMQLKQLYCIQMLCLYMQHHYQLFLAHQLHLFPLKKNLLQIFEFHLLLM
jgi:hypothetical protein